MGNATFYQIKETLTPCSAEEIFSRKPGDPPYVVIMDPETWNNTKEKFDMVIDMDMDPSEVLETKAIVNFDSLHPLCAEANGDGRPSAQMRLRSG